MREEGYRVAPHSCPTTMLMNLTPPLVLDIHQGIVRAERTIMKAHTSVGNARYWGPVGQLEEGITHAT